MSNAAKKLSATLFESLAEDVKGFNRLAEFLKGATGISLPSNPKNHSLMASRVQKMLGEMEIVDYQELFEAVKTNQAVRDRFIVALTTNTTYFFREEAHFEYLHKNLAKMLAAKRAVGDKSFRVWCSAASTGQEPYGLAMTFMDLLPANEGWNFKMLATDIDLKVLNTAATGNYKAAEFEKMPDALRLKYFTRGKADDGSWTASTQLKNKITFAPLNLMEQPYSFSKGFDIIFCRNVLIYFESATSSQVVQSMVDHLNPGGWLFLGHSESGVMKSPNVKTLAHAVYERI